MKHLPTCRNLPALCMATLMSEMLKVSCKLLCLKPAAARTSLLTADRRHASSAEVSPEAWPG